MSISCQKGLYEVASLQGLATPLNPTFEQFEQENWKIGFVGYPLSILNIINRGGPTFLSIWSDRSLWIITREQVSGFSLWHWRRDQWDYRQVKYFKMQNQWPHFLPRIHVYCPVASNFKHWASLICCFIYSRHFSSFYFCIFALSAFALSEYFHSALKLV